MTEYTFRVKNQETVVEADTPMDAYGLANKWLWSLPSELTDGFYGWFDTTATSFYAGYGVWD